MDDIDGALFSRVPLNESGISLDRLEHQSILPVRRFSQGCNNDGKYSNLENYNSTFHLNEKLVKSGQNQSDEAIIKRESVQVFHCVSPRYKDTRTQVKSQSQLSSRGSAPCSLNTECVTEPVDTSTRQSNNYGSLLVPQRPFIKSDTKTQNTSSSGELHVLKTKKLDSDKTALIYLCKEKKADNSTRDESHGGILHRAEYSSSSSVGSSSSFGDVNSNRDGDPLIGYIPPSVQIKSNQMKKSDTELVHSVEKGLLKNMYKSIESIETSDSRVRFVSYLNEDEILFDTEGKYVEHVTGATLFTPDIKAQNDQNGNMSTASFYDKTSKDDGTDTTDACDKQCTENAEPVVFDNKTDKLTSIGPLGNQTMLKNNTHTKRKKPIVCRIITGLAFPVLSLVIYIWDIGSDIRLAIAYNEQGDINLFWITAACIVIPIILMSIVDVSWLWLDRPPNNVSHIVRYILGVFTLGRIVRSVIYMWHIIKSKTLNKEEEKLWHKKRATEEKRDCFMLDFINAFAESVPQLFVQMYLMYAFDLQLTKIRTLNLLSSWASIAWTYSAYYKCNREVLVGKQDIKIIGFAIFFLSVLSALAARVICVVLFLIYFKTWIGVTVLTVHFTYMLLWIIFKENPTLEGTTSSKFGKYLYCIFFAYVSLLCFLNLRNGRAKFRMVAFYLLIYIENFTLASLSFYTIYSSEVRNDKLFNLLALPIGFVLHLFLLVLYYKIFHPSTGRR